MKLVYGDLWTYTPEESDIIWRGVTTNTTLKNDGCLTMGSGCAGEAKAKFPGITKDWGKMVEDYGTVTFIDPARHLFAFPTKTYWKEPSTLELIKDSTEQLHALAETASNTIFVLPRPGVGKGALRWIDVKPIVETLPDNVHVITFEK